MDTPNIEITTQETPVVPETPEIAADNGPESSPTPEKKKRVWLLHLLAFGIPFLLMLAAFALAEVFPFGLFSEDAEHPLGNQQILNFDFWHQYYPFLQIFQQKLQAGGSMFYSWISGLGTNFTAMIAYYIASPLNLLTLLVPANWLREAVTVGVLIKIGVAGLSFSIFAKKMFKRRDGVVLVFSCLYALCNFATGYYWNIMWLDTFCIFPLVMLGVHEMFVNSKFKLFTVTVALSLIMNYYIGYMVCVFVAISFFAYCALYKITWKGFVKRLALFGIFSALACMISAFITVPAFIGLQSAHGTTASYYGGISLYRGFESLFAALFAFHDPTPIDGLPNIFCGLICVVLVFVFFWNTKFTAREKLTALAVILFLFVSLNLNFLDYFWHGFHFPNQVPHRFAFIFSFCLITLALRALSKIDHLDRWDVVGSAIFGVLFLIAGAFAIFNTNSPIFRNNTVDSKVILVLNIALGTFYLLMIFLKQKQYVKSEGFVILLCFAAIMELLPSSFIGVKAVGTTSYSGYDYNRENVNTLVAYAESQQEDKTQFYRMEFTQGWSCNDPALYGYNGVSQFSSTANVGVTAFMHAMGMPADEASNRYAYAQNTPIANAFLNLKYLMHKDVTLRDQNYLEKRTVASVALYENTAYLPLGFMTDSGIKNLELNGKNFIETQNNLFRLATGLEKDVFVPIELYAGELKGINVREVTQQDDGDYFTNYNYRYDTIEGSQELDLVMGGIATATGSLYGYITVPGAKDAQIFIGNALERSVDMKDSRVEQCAVYLGEVVKGQNFRLSAKIDSIYINGYCNLRAGILDKAVFEEGFERLEDETMTLTQFSDSKVAGAIVARTDGVLYTSIPYDKGWTVTVDGVKTETFPIGGAMLGIELKAGAHGVEFSYTPQGFVPGVILSAAGVLIFAALCVLTRKRPFLYEPAEFPAVSQKLPPVTKESEAEAEATSEAEEASEETPPEETEAGDSEKSAGESPEEKEREE